ncbi:hypothetical protein REIP_1839 [Rickettsia endosymbiont of Ixodes pacificus]|nr:hypothetical protein REIP_1839 [Rickettsia endosymbiont of Ixodes pacificus]
MVHLVSKGSNITQEQEIIRTFGKGLVQEQIVVKMHQKA